ncbi:hypothetical protein ACH42_12165 [Endozoicomonas sp. (ex Bugula neritina AB1)]|nr:hypothetical protein ACH42_12165 [Endozoicomonas sp. (ex Bugula neritina AB1)]
MSLNGHKGFLLAALAGTVLNVQAAKSEYNLLAVYQLAQKNDAQLAAAQASMMATQEVVPQSKARLLPSINLSANANYNDGSKPDVGSYSTNGWGANLTQPLLNMNSWYGLNQAEAQSAQAEAVFANEQQQLILRVSEAYFNVLRAEDGLTTSKVQETAVKQQLDQARERYNVGLIAETDVLEAQAAYDNARVSRILGENQVSVAYEGLRTITDHSVTDIAKLEKTMPVNAPMPANSDEWVTRAVENNLALQAARKGLDASEQAVRASKANHLPTINAVAGYNVSSTGLDAKFGGADTEGAQIGLQFSLPIFSGGATSSQVRQSAYQLVQAQQTYDNNLRVTNSNTRNLFRTVNSDVGRVDARCQGITSSESALKATQSGYEVGTRNITDVLDAQQKLFSATGDYLNARYDYIVNTLKLKQAAGTLSPADLTDLNNWMVSSRTTAELEVPTECRAK